MVMRFIHVAMMTLLGATLASAQSTRTLEGNIPFAFEMRGIVLPAGEYLVDFARDQSLISLHAKEGGKNAAFVVTFAVYPRVTERGQAKLIFNKYGERYFLSQIWHPSFVRELPKSKQERELVTSRVLAQNPIRVVIAARLVR
jgi:hypothetical protein